jgi:hypothetical protein
MKKLLKETQLWILIAIVFLCSAISIINNKRHTNAISTKLEQVISNQACIVSNQSVLMENSATILSNQISPPKKKK